jgi:hypothetical protein
MWNNCDVQSFTKLNQMYVIYFIKIIFLYFYIC